MKIIILLLILTNPLFSYDLTTLDGYWWKSITISQALSFVQGFLLGQYMMSELLIKEGVINSEEEYQKLLKNHIHNVTDIQIVKEVTEYYINTGDLRKPVIIVIYIRNIYKGGKEGRL